MRTLILFVSFACFSCAQSSPPHRIDQESQPKKNTGDTKPASPPAPSPANQRATPVIQLSTTKEKNYSHQQTKPGQTDWPGWVLVAVGAAGVIVANRTLNAIKKQTAETVVEMKDASRATREAVAAYERHVDVLINGERAWVVPITITKPMLHETDDSPNSFTFDLINVGRTVARLTGPFKHRFCSLPRKVELAETPDYGGTGAGGAEPVCGRVLAPRQRNGPISLLLGESVDSQELSEIENGKVVLYAYVSLTYYDAFGKDQRVLQFGYMYQPKVGNDPPQWVPIRKPEYNKHT